MSDTSDTSARQPTPIFVLAMLGMVLGSAVFLGGMFIGMEIDPRVDMPSRLFAYTVALFGLTTLCACRWTLATQPVERKICAAITLAVLAFSVGYALVML